MSRYIIEGKLNNNLLITSSMCKCGTLVLPKNSISYVSASITASNTDSGGVADLTIMLRVNNNSISESTCADNPSMSATSLSFIYETGNEPATVELVGLSGTNVFIRVNSFNALVYEKPTEEE